jgi:para-nitrobenzyl esterase
MVATRVETAQGTLEGVDQEGVVVFRGVPFARPPVGQRRFCPPEAPLSWDGVRAATEFGPACPQPSTPELAMLSGGLERTSEDCLYLNVWTPAPDGGRRPTMVWIHGGAFVIGSGSQPWYDGAGLASRGDVVVVTLNYRLGALGFSYLGQLVGPELASSGNVGLLDQVAALEWVRDNIAAFGGDPGNVTVFGESAGAMSVGTLLGTPRAQGLFHRAIAQSGAADMVSSPERATEVARALADRLGLDGAWGPELAEALRRLEPEALVAAQQEMASDGAGVLGVDSSGALAFCPVVDGHVLPQAPLQAVTAGQGAKVPLLIGTNRHEMRLFSMLDPSLSVGDADELPGRLARVLGAPERAQRLLVAGAAGMGDEAGPAQLWEQLAGDWVFGLPARRLADSQGRVNGGAVWSYLFAWESPLMDGALGACHALEVPFVFGTFSDPMTAMFVGAGPEASQLSARIQDAWLAFARHGDPATPSLPPWPPCRPPARPTMVLGRHCQVEQDPLGARAQAWEQVLA